MEVSEQIRRFHEFMELHLQAELFERVRKGEESLSIDFALLSRFDPDLSDILLDQPEDTIKAAELAVQQFDLPIKTKKFKIRIKNLPLSQKINVREIRSKHINRFICTEGIVRQKSDVRPQVTSARFECPSCGNIINVLQLDEKFKEPTRCGCGRKAKFTLISKELIDAQGITLEESPDSLEGGEQPKRMKLLLKNDLVSPISDKKTNPGNKILISGIVKELPKTARDGVKLTQFDLLIDTNYVEAVNNDFSDIIIDEEEKKQIVELISKENTHDIIVDSLAPGIYGHREIKLAILLQLMGGVKKERNDGVQTRGDIHILLIGDPGAGKSQLLKRVSKIAPKSRFVSGKGASGAGLTASVVKDEFIGGWALEGGALVLANKGFCMIDELDKMSTDDRSAMHEALEGQTVTIAKANIQATLRCETTVLAAANPKYGRYDPYEMIAKQINLPPPLLNRFDLLFAIRDLPNEDQDKKLARFILNLHQTGDVTETKISSDLLRKFIAYVRQNSKPKISEEASSEMMDYYVKMRNPGKGEDGEISPVSISARQLEALVRLTEASAKVRMQKIATKADARRAIDLVHYSLMQLGVDPDTGKIDIDRMTTGIASSERNKIHHIKEIIDELENQVGKTIPIEDVVALAKEKGIKENQTEELIQKLKRSGDIFEPRRGFLSRI